ncbi:Condensin-2 complex subunit H2 [Halocaridina rubra]|uniref:Condensin-2 complex subunit H2 n=1 Tax=Halocaridina rubra TaxID=373956 RepID=A0AAN8XAP5_HALRR
MTEDKRVLCVHAVPAFVIAMPRGPQVSPTQELEPRFSIFLNPIRDLTKNWEVDIAKYMEDYLEELAEIQITFDGGETLMNFAEAAILIQGSAMVYGKKVEFLWQMVLQMLDLLHSRRTSDLQGNEEGAKEGGGGPRTSLDSTRDFTCINDISEGRNINMKDDDEDDCGRRKAFKFLPETPLHLVEKEGEKSQHRINLFMKNGEVFGAKDDFRINRSYLTPLGVLCLEVPSDLLQDNGPAILHPIAEEEIDDIIGDIESPPSPMEEVEPAALPQEDDVGDVATHSEDDGGQPNEPDEIPQPMEMENEEKNDKIKDGNGDNIGVIDLPVGRYGLRKRGMAEKENIVKLKLSDPWKPIDPHAETPAKRPIRAGRLRKPLPCACHRPVQRVSVRSLASINMSSYFTGIG